jgi:hypothetical protein
MAKIWKSEEFAWKGGAFIKKVKNFYGKRRLPLEK